MNRPRHRNGARAWGLLLLAMVGLALMVGWPLQAIYQSGEDDIARLERRLFQYQQLAARRDSLTQRHASLGSDEARSPWFDIAADPALSSAQLQQRFREAIDSSGGRLASLQPLEQEELEHGIVRVALTARFHGQLDAVQRALHNIQSARPALNIDELTISAATKRNRGAPLTVQAVISGYFRGRLP